MILQLRIPYVGREVDVVAEKLQGRLWYHLNGETHVFEPDSTSSRKSADSTLKADRIEAPMPGKILRVEVKTGDRVQAGQVLVVMEAMKMEYSLAAAANGTVEEVRSLAGEQVPLGQILVRLKVADA